MPLYVTAANCSHPQGATSADMYSVLYSLSNINGKIFIHISVIKNLLNYNASEVLKLCKNLVSKHLVIEDFS